MGGFFCSRQGDELEFSELVLECRMLNAECKMMVFPSEMNLKHGRKPIPSF